LFCWKLSYLAKQFEINTNEADGQVKICNFFGVTGAEHEGDCWKGQISSHTKGKGNKKVDYNS